DAAVESRGQVLRDGEHADVVARRSEAVAEIGHGTDDAVDGGGPAIAQQENAEGPCAAGGADEMHASIVGQSAPVVAASGDACMVNEIAPGMRKPAHPDSRSRATSPRAGTMVANEIAVRRSPRR